jgi:hypothetical protein
MNPLQRAALTRKVIYFAAILVLFTLSMVWRGTIPVPLGTSAARVAQPLRWANDHTIQSQSQRMELSELDPTETEADVTGTAVRLMLTGSRGFAVAFLWHSAIEKQKRNDFHEFEKRVVAVTKLQPHFITPWIFQSWNIAYNVSVEMHGSGDMYFYIARGIELLAEGERRNKRSPDMRYQIAFYYQNKFGVSDQVETLRCLFALSCIPPSERNPNNFVNPTTKEIDRDAFQRFCEKYPHLVRRLRGEDTRDGDKRAKEKLRAPTPEDVVQFLRDNQKVPSRYKLDADGNPTDELADADKQFPALPPEFEEGRDEANPTSVMGDDFTAFKAARAWFSYSLLLLPPNPRDENNNPIPGPTPRPGEHGHDPFKHRIPRLPMLIIFRQGAPRAQTYQAEMEQKEGWFDDEGWRIDDPTDDAQKWWFPDHPDLARRTMPRDVVVGKGRAWSLVEWQKAAEMWRKHGNEYALTLPPDRLANLRADAGDPNTLPSDPTPEQMADPAFRRRYTATNALFFYNSNRQVTNFPYFLAAAEAEARVIDGRPVTVLARKTLWRAEQARKLGNTTRAIDLYKDGLLQWKRVLADNPDFHRQERSDKVEEETYEYELAYQRLLVQDSQAVRDRANLIARTAHGVVPFLTEPFPRLAPGQQYSPDPLWPSTNREEIKWFVVETVGDADFSSPFVGSFAPDGGPWVREDLKGQVRMKQGVQRRTPGQQTAPPSDPNAPPLPQPPKTPPRPGG